MYSFQEEKFLDCITEIIPLLEKHWEEVARHKELRPIDPDYDRYAKLNELGLLKVFTARKNGKLIGYLSIFIAPNLHYQSWVFAVSDVYYIDKASRRAGVRFFLEAEQWLRDQGVRVVIYQDKIAHSHENFFTRMGYTKTEQVYEKVL